jgi:hypothetical protein
MRKTVVLTSSVFLFAALGTAGSTAEDSGRPQDGFYSGQSNGRYSGQSKGQVSERIDGRGNKNEGVPPSAADKDHQTYVNPAPASACSELNSISPDARPGWEGRTRAACQ